jgi:hypothetical protein
MAISTKNRQSFQLITVNLFGMSEMTPIRLTLYYMLFLKTKTLLLNII